MDPNNNIYNPVQQYNPNQQMMNNQVNYQNVIKRAENPLEELNNAKEAIIKQKIEIFEILSGFETPNRYYVYVKDPNSGDKNVLFKCKEESGCCMRNCCSSESRSFKMKVKHIIDENDKKSSKKDFAEFDRPFKCTCCCLARPEMTARIGEKVIGKVVTPCTVCDPLFHVYDNNNNLKWQIHADYCQCGVCCRSSYGRCSEVIFPIYSGDKTDFDKSKSDGLVKKVFKGQDLISDASTFHINFPSNATAEDKFMLISTVLMIDYQYYEESSGGKHHHRNRLHQF